MNIKAVFQSNVTASMITTYTSTNSILSNEARLANDTSGYDTAKDQKDSEDNGLIAVYVIVPALVLAGILTVFILIIQRRKRRNHIDKNSDCSESKEASKNHDLGVDNGAFSHQYQNEKHQGSNDSKVPSAAYEEINDNNIIYYENEQDVFKQSENMYYDYNSQNRQNVDIVEDEYGYGQFKQESNCYQNVMKQSGTNNLGKKIEPSFAEEKFHIEYDSEPVYVNESATQLESEKETRLKTHSVEEVDPLYDHAKAGGHEWDNRENPRIEMIKSDSFILENLYMNDSNNYSQDKDANSNDDAIESDNKTGKIPVYVELEPETDEDNVKGKLESRETKVDITAIGEVYDYASSEGICNDVKSRIIDHPKESASDNYSFKLYSNVEKENRFEEDENEYDSASNHEYFILEKVDR